MSLSRLTGVVAFLLFGTALAVWWYLEADAGARSSPLHADQVFAAESPLDPADDAALVDAELQELAAPAASAPAATETWTRRPAGAVANERIAAPARATETTLTRPAASPCSGSVGGSGAGAGSGGNGLGQAEPCATSAAPDSIR